ncbi:uncharacterized protein DNG_07811 [Cephalotrichum gorgonifer]|uniref:DUF1857 domain-containing protein n=1 Tax=Cephalotrichum gorgonifer TaxID=2041049 RepID=A0AAE8N2B5_9PEZI|nr:uncharacterized protein DNG_07811 [Cephalotrichum gorgonifer]
MVTINLAVTVPLNPPGAPHPLIAPAQAWAGLVRKARRPQDFVPVVKGCAVTSETPTQIAAEVYFHPGVEHALAIKEVCTLRAPSRLDYAMEGGSTAVNIVSRTPAGDLMLTFVFEWAHPDVAEGSEKAAEVEQGHLCVATKAVQNTAMTIRRLAAAGELGSS